MFPVLNVRMNFAQEQEEHKVVHAFLHEFLAVVWKGQQDPAAVDIDALRQLVEEGKGPLVRALDELLMSSDILKYRLSTGIPHGPGGRAPRSFQAEGRRVLWSGAENDVFCDRALCEEQRGSLLNRPLHAQVRPPIRLLCTQRR